MSTLGGTGWWNIGLRYGVAFFWLLVLSAIILVAAFLYFLLKALGVGGPLVPILSEFIVLLSIPVLLGWLGITAAFCWTFVWDLGHNFYTVLQKSGFRAAWNGLKADLSACGNSFGNGLQTGARNHARAVVSWIKDKWTWLTGG